MGWFNGQHAAHPHSLVNYSCFGMVRWSTRNACQFIGQLLMSRDGSLVNALERAIIMTRSGYSHFWPKQFYGRGGAPKVGNYILRSIPNIIEIFLILFLYQSDNN